MAIMCMENVNDSLLIPGICRSCRKLLLDGQNKSVNKSINQEKVCIT